MVNYFSHLNFVQKQRILQSIDNQWRGEVKYCQRQTYFFQHPPYLHWRVPFHKLLSPYIRIYTWIHFSLSRFWNFFYRYLPFSRHISKVTRAPPLCLHKLPLSNSKMIKRHIRSYSLAFALACRNCQVPLINTNITCIYLRTLFLWRSCYDLLTIYIVTYCPTNPPRRHPIQKNSRGSRCQ